MTDESLGSSFFKATRFCSKCYPLKMSFWEISPIQVELLRGGDGGPLRDFCVRIIRAHACVNGIPDSAIATDSRNVGDGGVDCQVSEAAANDSLNRFRAPTCWQFKAMKHNSISDETLRKEINKTYCKQLIEKGYAYRLCIADSLTAEKKQKWETILNVEAKKINSQCPDPQVLTSDCLAEWANHYLAVVMAHLGTDSGSFFHIDDWGKSIVQPTPEYVQVPGWESQSDAIKEHVDFSKPSNKLVFPIHGDAGVGKTRLVYESLVNLPRSRSLVVYTSDDQAAQDLAFGLAKNTSKFVMLVIDECSMQARNQIEQTLRGHTAHVRIITIGNYERSTATVEPSLQRMPNDIVEKILVGNFPTVPDEQRRAAATLAGGFVKIAADIRGLIYRLGASEITAVIVTQALQRLQKAIDNEKQAVPSALELVRRWIDSHKTNQAALEFDNAALWDLIAEFLQIPPEDGPMSLFYWREVMNIYRKVSAEKASYIVCSLLGESFSVAEEAKRVALDIARTCPQIMMEHLGARFLDLKNGWKLQVRGYSSVFGQISADVVMGWLDKHGVEGARIIMGSIPKPYIDTNGVPVVPDLALKILTRFGNDAEVQDGYVVERGVRSYSGDISGQKHAEAEVAAKFLNHPLEAIRKWAKLNKERAEHEAEFWQRDHAERFL